MSIQFNVQNVLKRAESLDISPQFQPYSGVEIITGEKDEDGNSIIYTAGDESGRVLTIENPWGTQAQADNILNSIRGFQYQPYSASKALLDPSAELGDGVSVNDVYSGIYKMSRNYSSLMEADVSAPQSEEINHEYPFETKASRAIERKFSAVESELRMTSREIAAKVSETGGNNSSFGWSLKSNGFSLYAGNKEVFKCTSSGVEVNGKITATSGKIGGFDIGSNSISYNGLTWNGTRNGVYLGTSGIQLGSASGSYFQASANGNVKAHNMTLTGTLNIGGANITAAALRSGAQSAYSNGGSWTTGATRAAGYYNATQNGTSNYPTYFTANNLIAKNRCDAAYMNVSNTFNAAGTFNVGGITAYWREVTISGTTIRYLGRA